MVNLEGKADSTQRQPVEVTVIDDDSDITGWLASAARVGEVCMQDTPSMVANVISAADGNPISRLNILDHGDASGFQLGNDWIEMESLPLHAGELAALRGRFAPGGFVHIQACDIGQNEPLLKEVSKILDVPVYAGTGLQNPVYRYNTGSYVQCVPSACAAAGRP